MSEAIPGQRPYGLYSGEALAALSHESLNKTKTSPPVFAFTSGKGGVGKTSVVANLATVLAWMGEQVMVIDADLGLANLDLFLGVRPNHNLADFFTGHATLEDIITVNRDGILLLPGASGVQEITSLGHDQKVSLLTELDALTHEMDRVLVDTSSGISDTVTYFTTAAQEIVLVVTPEPSSITDAYALVKVLASRFLEKRFWILANNVASENEALRLFDTLSGTALRFLNASLDLLGWIPHDAELVTAVASSRPVVVAAKNSSSAEAFRSLAERLIGLGRAQTKIKGSPQFFFRRAIESARGDQ
jgi:flagellar biosynthesis protein FlhG